MKALETGRSTQRLDAESEFELVRRHKHGDSRAWGQLAAALEPFVLKIAFEYRRYGLPKEDIAQEGRIGLLKAIMRFDETRGVRLATYAAYWIRAEIREYVVRAYRLTRIGGSKGDRRALRYYRKTRERDPEKLALASGISVERANALLPLLMARDVDLDAHDSASGHPLSERLAHPGANPEQAMAEQEQAWRGRALLDQAVRELAPREREIVRSRWMTEEPETLEEIGRRFGISKERVRQLEERAKGQIKQKVELLGQGPMAA